MEQSQLFILQESSLTKHAGMQVMELVRKNIRPRDIMTEDAILKCTYGVGYGTWMLYKQHASPSGNRT